MKPQGWLARTLAVAPKLDTESGSSLIAQWDLQSKIALFAVTAAASFDSDWPDCPQQWLAVTERTRRICIRNNIMYSLVADAIFDDDEWLLKWSDLLASEILDDHDVDNLQQWHLSTLVAQEALLQPGGPCNGRFSEFFQYTQFTGEDQAVIEIALAALSVIVTLSAGILLVQQFARPSREFLQIRELAKQHDWARRLARRGPRLADRTVWTVAASWDQSIFGSAPEAFESISTACRLIAEVTTCKCIEPSVAMAFDESSMKVVGQVKNAWVLSVKTLGLKQEQQVIQPAMVECGSSDRLALQTTSHHRLSQFCLARLQEAAKASSTEFHQDVLEAVQGAAQTSTEFCDWLRLIACHSPQRDLQVFEPLVGDRLNEHKMVARNEVWSPGRAIVSEVVYSGLMRGSKILLPAVVETLQE